MVFSSWSAAIKRTILATGVAAASMMLAGTAMAQNKGYAIRWVQIGGTWKTGLYYSVSPQCVHGHKNANCMEDFRGNYNHGEVTTFWLNGCQRPPVRIQCTVEPLL